jgi:hypothetical protein
MPEGMEPYKLRLPSGFREVRCDSADKIVPWSVPYRPLCGSSIAVTCPCSHTILDFKSVLAQSHGVNSVNLHSSHLRPCSALYNWLMALHSESASAADLPLHGDCDGEGCGPGGDGG